MKARLRALKRALGAAVDCRLASLRVASLDSSRISVLPEAVVRPRSEEEVGRLLRLANAYGCPVVPRGGGSATTGAATPVAGGWVLDLSAWKACSFDDCLGLATAQAGITLEQLNARARRRAWCYSPDPSSKSYCTLGGTIATNAGGPRAARYGVTRDAVVALEGFLPTGDFVRLGRPLKKFAAGYNLRDLWVGSEGTLGVITAATVKLRALPKATWTLLAAFEHEQAALRAGKRLLSARVFPSALEFLDGQTVACLGEEYLGSFLKLGRGVSLLLVELQGHRGQVREDARSVSLLLKPASLAWKATWREEVAETFWAARRACSKAMFALGSTKLNEDVVVPPRAYERLLRFTRHLGSRLGLATPTFGHLADGNFHVHIMYEEDCPKQRGAAEVAVKALMEQAVQLGGAISGEHGVGLTKSPFLSLGGREQEVAAMRAIKRALDPKGILNPHKLFEPFYVWEHPKQRTWPLPWQ